MIRRLIPDTVFANAGIGESGGFVKLLASPPGSNPPEKPDLKTIDIDLIGTTYTVYLAAHYLRQNATPGGKIVATSSSLGFYGEPMFPLYCAAKAGVSFQPLYNPPIQSYYFRNKQFLRQRGCI